MALTGVSKTLQLHPNQSIVGAGRLFSSIVPHKSVPPTCSMDNDLNLPRPRRGLLVGPPGVGCAWPLVQTALGADDVTAVAFLSVLVWHHYNSTYAVHWQSGHGQWRAAHVNRVDLDPGRIGPPAWYNQALFLMDGTGGGRFWNFYQENWWSEGPDYRHILVRNTTSPLAFYHGNTEHSQGEANMEIAGT